VFSIDFLVRAKDAERLSAEIWDLGAAGIQEEDAFGGDVVLRGYFPAVPELPPELAQIVVAQRSEPDTDWEAEARAQWPA